MELTLAQFLSRFVLQPPLATAHSVISGRRAAVLVPVIDGDQPELLLTRRSALLRKHAGQVAFPGGMMDATDDSLIATVIEGTGTRLGGELSPEGGMLAPGAGQYDALLTGLADTIVACLSAE